MGNWVLGAGYLFQVTRFSLKKSQLASPSSQASLACGKLTLLGSTITRFNN